MGGVGFGGRWGRGRSPRARRGAIRAALLALLSEGPRHGYQLIQELAERSGGVWQPSPGSVYPTLQQLEDEGLIRAEKIDGRRVFHLTDRGRTEVEARTGAAPWKDFGGAVGGDLLAFRALLIQLGTAVHQVTQAGSDAQRAEAVRVLTDARRALYRILAEDGPTNDS